MNTLRLAVFGCLMAVCAGTLIEDRLLNPIKDDPHKLRILAWSLILMGTAITFFGARVYKVMMIIFGFIAFFNFGFYTIQSFLKDNDSLWGVCVGLGVIGGAVTFRFTKFAKCTVGLVSGILLAYISYLAFLHFIDGNGENKTALYVVVTIAAVGGCAAGMKATQLCLTIMTAVVGAFLAVFGVDLLTDQQFTIQNIERSHLNDLGYGLLAVWIVMSTLGTYYQFFGFKLCSACWSKVASSKASQKTQELVNPLLDSAKPIISSLYTPAHTVKGRTGLANTGNTCFLNASVQALYAVAPLREAIMSQEEENRRLSIQIGTRPQTPMTELLGNVLGKLHRATSHSISPSELRSIAAKLEFNDGRQHDATELMRGILNAMIEEIPEGDKNRVKQIFGFDTVGVVHCCGCGAESETRESTIDLALDIPTAAIAPGMSITTTTNPLEDLIRRYFAGTDLDGDDLYQCDSCNQRTKATRTTHLSSLPEALVLTLNRFRFSKETMSKKKMMDNVVVPPYLPIATAEYELVSMVVHSGVSADGGHYYAFSKLPSKPGMEQWFKFDDRCVSETCYDNIHSLCKSLPTDTPYLLVYQKMDA